MIKLELPIKPIELTTEFEKEAILKYKANKDDDFWKQDFIKEAVKKIAFGKCCYSESYLSEESNFMEIDHFYPKSIFPEKIVEWGNLLPSNKKCNGTKLNYNPINEPIINPLFDNPKEHLYIENYRFRYKSEIGKSTIEKVALNDYENFQTKRNRIGTEILDKLEDLATDLELFKNDYITNLRKKNHFVKKVKKLLFHGKKDQEYSALVSTIILLSEEYKVIENFLIENNFGDSEFEELKKELEFCCLKK